MTRTTSKKTRAAKSRTAAAAPRTAKAAENRAASASKTAAKTVEQATETAQAGATQAVAQVEKAAEATAAKAETGRKAAFSAYDDLVGLQQGAFDAVMQSGSIMARGYEAIGKEVMTFTQSSLEANMAAAKAIFGARNLQELLDKQAGFTRESLDKAVAESAKLSEMAVKLTREAAAPIQARVNAAVESVTKQVAA